MKEERYFYVPDASVLGELPEEEAIHAVRVLRLKEGDELMLMDGEGTFFKAVVTSATGKRCCYAIENTLPQQRQWPLHLHLAIAPTKMMERMEWLAEKATEIGFDELSFLDCRFSERRMLKTQRIEKIVVAAMKQSRKAWKPVVNEMQAFSRFIGQHTTGLRFIAHCYEEVPRVNLFHELARFSNTPFSGLAPNAPESQFPDSREVLVLVGPEGDFSIDEVRQALDAGFVSVSLGESRLRTETAGLAAVMMMQLAL